MELFAEYSKELVSLIVVGLSVGGVMVFALVKTIDSGKLDSKETRIFVREKEFGE